MIDIGSAWLMRVAAYSAWIALAALIGSGITIALFFGGAGAFWGPINDLFTAVALVALVLPVLAVDRMAGPAVGAWLRIVTGFAIAGLLLAATGQVLLVLGVIPLEASFVTGGIGILPVFVWLVAVAILGLGFSAVPATVAWLAVAVIVLSAATAAVSSVTTGPPSWIAAAGLVIVLSAWLVGMAMTFGERAVA